MHKLHVSADSCEAQAGRQSLSHKRAVIVSLHRASAKREGGGVKKVKAGEGPTGAEP